MVSGKCYTAVKESSRAYKTGIGKRRASYGLSSPMDIGCNFFSTAEKKSSHRKPLVCSRQSLGVPSKASYVGGVIGISSSFALRSSTCANEPASVERL